MDFVLCSKGFSPSFPLGMGRQSRESVERRVEIRKYLEKRCFNIFVKCQEPTSLGLRVPLIF